MSENTIRECPHCSAETERDPCETCGHEPDARVDVTAALKIETRATRFDSMPGGGVCHCIHDDSPVVCDDCPNREREETAVRASGREPIIHISPPPRPPITRDERVADVARAKQGLASAEDKGDAYDVKLAVEYLRSAENFLAQCDGQPVPYDCLVCYGGGLADEETEDSDRLNCEACDGTGKAKGNTDEGPPPVTLTDVLLHEAETAKPCTYRVLKKETFWREHTLTTEEKLKASERANDRGDALVAARRRYDNEKADAAERVKAAKVEVDEAEAAHASALEARHTGIEKRAHKAERRANIPAATIDLVLVETGEVVESVAMTEAEQAKHCRQSDIVEVTKGATITPDPTPAPVPEPTTELGEKLATALKKDERDACGIPLAWTTKTWRVKTDQHVDPWTMGGEDVRQVYLVVPDAGEGLKVKDLVDRQTLRHMPRQAIAKALQLLADKGLARCGEGKRWVTTPPGTKPAPEPEPGRKDALPESDAGARPKLSEPATKADALLADAADVAATFKPAGMPA